MLPLETKQSGGKLLPHSDLRGGVFLEEVSRSRKRNRDILLGTWNVRSLYRAGSLMAATRELARYKLDLVGVQEVRWVKEGTVKAGDYSFFIWERKWKSSVGNRVFCASQNSIRLGITEKKNFFGGVGILQTSGKYWIKSICWGKFSGAVSTDWWEVYNSNDMFR